MMMKNWRQSVLFDFLDTEKADQTFAVIVMAAQSLGFEFCTYGFSSLVSQNNNRPVTGALSNYPTLWEKRYNEAQYQQHDPVVLHAYRFQTPILWEDATFASIPQLWDEARSCGLKTGLSIATRIENKKIGMLNLSRSTEILTETELQEKVPQIHWLLDVMHSSFTNILNPIGLHEILDIHLTNRETEILKWTADGKCAQDIAEILCISKNTVAYHMKNAIRKLHVPNKTAAVVRALKLGLLNNY
ncbi:autoinducer binding domain-containing protein [Saezia sanguinis]|uniref:autoinducer binding domain-containing protein n=1 Tax=Saezia sanguinis TaxID=1965230 RepID=UPI0030745D5C